MFKKILFCTDFSENSHYAFTYALHLARTYRSKLLILHVTPDTVFPEQLSIYLTNEKIEEFWASQKEAIDQDIKTNYIQKMEGFDHYQISLKEGEPFLEIIRTAREESADLVVMGTHGRTGLDHIFFGSTAERVVRKSPCPVMTIRLPGREFVMP
jgi:nucleotide-binding universal stress UspA family protein